MTTCADPHTLREKVVLMRSAYNHGQATIEQLYAAADAYLEVLRAAKRAGKIKSVPSRAQLIRQL